MFLRTHIQSHIESFRLHITYFFVQTFQNVQLPIYDDIVNTSQHIDKEGRSSIETPHFSDNDTLEARLRLKNIYKNEYISAPNIAQHFSLILHFQMV